MQETAGVTPLKQSAVSDNSSGPYRGRFAPSPTGPLHMGSLACAVASWVDARAHGGAWIIRNEDIDTPRVVKGSMEHITGTLAGFGLVSDEAIVRQSERHDLYRRELERLKATGMAYGCSCTRQQVKAAGAAAGLPSGVYPGTCRSGSQGETRAWRFLTKNEILGFDDRICGSFSQNIEHDVGDFVLLRADGFWAYQLAVVADDHDQGITDIVRGADLLDNTPRQIALQRALGYKTPRYMHIPLVVNESGEKLSKQRLAPAVDASDPLAKLDHVWQHLGFEKIGADSIDAFWVEAVSQWKERFV